MSNDVRVTEDRSDDPDERGLRDHLDDVGDGCGCTEIWEHLESQRRDGSE